MSVLISIIFLGCGAFFETIYFILEKMIIKGYSRKGKVRNKTLYRVPFELLYWSKFPAVSTVLYYMATSALSEEFTIMQILFYFSIFAMGMFVLNEFFKELK